MNFSFRVTAAKKICACAILKVRLRSLMNEDKKIFDREKLEPLKGSFGVIIENAREFSRLESFHGIPIELFYFWFYGKLH